MLGDANVFRKHRKLPSAFVLIDVFKIVFTGKIRCCVFWIYAFQYWILFDVITAIYLLGREKNTRPAQCLARETTFVRSGISAVKSGSEVLKFYGDWSVL